MKRKPRKSAIDGFKEWEKDLMRESKRSFYNAPLFERLYYLFFAAVCLLIGVLFFYLLEL